MFSPTDEQLAAVEMFRGGDSLAIEAGAGTGKTSTLILLGSVDPYRRGMYVAFNKAIVTEAGEKMPRSVTCSTAHSLAYRAVISAEGGRAYAARLRGSRMKSNEIAAILRIDPITVHTTHRSKPMARGFLANLVMRAVTRFCQTADPTPGIDHVPYIDGIDEPLTDGRRTYDNNMIVRRHIESAIGKAWGEIVDPAGRLPFKHDHYLKMWQLQGPKIDADYILFDEAQDANPVMVAIVAAQTHAQLVWVGDSQQAIYEFTGAVNALADVPADRRTLLTHSFRFGPEIAGVANGILEVLGADLRLTGRGRPGVIGPVADPDVLLTRTNATGVQTMFFELAQGRRPAIVGGAADVLAFARGATELREKGWTSHQDLTVFQSWGEVQEYCVGPGTRLLTSDLRWQPIELLEPGDKLVGFDEEAGPGTAGRSYRTTSVTATRTIERPCWRLTMEDGTTVVASVEHRWLTRTGKNNLRWQRTETLRPGSEIASVGPVWQEEQTRSAGWLAGMYDGEGWLTRPAKGTAMIGVSQNEGPLLERLREELKMRGFDFTDRSYSRCKRLTITGGLAEKLRFLGTIRPHRFIVRASELWEGNRVEARSRAVVRAIERLGPSEVVALTTDTGTFIAEGLLSHNCSNDEGGSDLALLVKLVDEFGSERIASALDNMPREVDADLLISTAHKAKGREWPSVKLAGDFPDPQTREMDPSEWRLLYVACTRARTALDATDCPHALDPRGSDDAAFGGER